MVSSFLIFSARRVARSYTLGRVAVGLADREDHDQPNVGSCRLTDQVHDPPPRPRCRVRVSLAGAAR